MLNYNQKSDWDKKAYQYIKSSRCILDAGCGIGRFIKQNPEKIIGLEKNRYNLNIAKKKGFNVIQGDISNIPFEDNKFDAIYTSHVIEHLTADELHQALKEFDRVLKPGGIIIIISPLLWKHFYSDLTHVKPYNPDCIIHYLIDSEQRTEQIVSKKYRVVRIHWRHMPLARLLFNDYKENFLKKVLKGSLFIIDAILYRLHLTFLLKKNGYMLIMRKIES